MDYLILTKLDYGEEWSLVKCGDLPTAERELDKAVRKGQDPVLATEMPYKVNIKIYPLGEETPKSKKTKPAAAGDVGVTSYNEANQDQDGPDKDTGPQSKSQI